MKTRISFAFALYSGIIFVMFLVDRKTSGYKHFSVKIHHIIWKGTMTVTEFNDWKGYK